MIKIRVVPFVLLNVKDFKFKMPLQKDWINYKNHLLWHNKTGKLSTLDLN